MSAIRFWSFLSHRSWLWICLIALISTGLVVTPNSYAMQFQVTKSSDSDDGVCDSDCSLREAIAAANANPGPDTIQLSATSYTLSLGASSGILITDDLTITGVQSSTTIIDAQNSARIFMIDEGVEVQLEELTLRNGSSASNGGAVLNWGKLSLRNLILENNSANYGGAIYSADSSLTIEGSILRSNQASNHGGAIVASETGLSLSQSQFSANQTKGQGGAIYIKDSGGTLDQLRLNGNQAGDAGGAIYIQSSSLRLSKSSFVENTSAQDGGALVSIESSLELSESSFEKNKSQGNGGAIYNLGQLELSESGLIGNSASLAGGGLHDAGSGASTIRNTTFSANQSADQGGGIAKSGSGSLNIAHATIARNSAQVEAGGISHAAGSLSLNHSLIAENAAPNGKDCVGSPTSAGFNLIESSAGCSLANPQSSDLLDQAAQLEGLGDNGGPTPSHGLRADSPALDGGSAVGSECAASDQRGVQRPQGSRCDIGALEEIQALLLEISFSPQTIKLGETSSLRYTITNSSDHTLTNISFVSSLSKGLQLTQSDQNSCGIVQITAESVSLSQAELNAGASCSFSLAVSTQEAGYYSASSRTIQIGSLQQGVAQASTLSVLNHQPSITSALLDRSSGVLTIRGEHFLKDSRIEFKQGNNKLALSDPSSIRYISARELQATLSPELYASLTAAQVIVRNPEPGGGESPPIAIQMLEQGQNYQLYLPMVVQ